MGVMNILQRISIILAVALLPFSASAADFRVGETVFIPQNEVISTNTYIGAGEVTLSGTLRGDVTIAGGKVILNSPISGDALVAGGSIDVLGRIQGDVRAVGGQVTIAAPVAGDLVVAAGKVHVLSGSTISGDLMVFGGDVTLDGAVNGNVRIYAGTVTINSLVGGEVAIKAGKSVSFGEHAVMGGVLAYTAPEEATVHAAAKLGTQVTFTKLEVAARSLGPSGLAAILATIAGVLLVMKLIVGAVTTVALVLLFPGFSRRIVENTFQNFWKATGVGFITLVVVPVALLLLAVTVLGLMIAAILGVFYALILLLASVYASVIAGSLLAGWIKKEQRVSWKWALLGSVALFALSLVPFVGWLIVFVFFLAALGTMGLASYHRALDGM